MRLSIQTGSNGNQVMYVLSNGLKSEADASALKRELKLGNAWYPASSVACRGANGSSYNYFKLVATKSNTLQSEVSAIKAHFLFDSRLAETRTEAKQPNVFIASVASLQAIINAPKSKHTGKHAAFIGKRKKQSRNERK